jgi:AcrR family transcriptional regulator
MPEQVNRRPYSSAIRAEQAARTRARIIEAAGELFGSQGYARTSIRAIAEKADVAQDTVYAVFGTKARVLTALIDARLAPSGAASVLDRPEAQAVRDEPDQHRQIHLFAQDIAAISARVRPVYEIMRGASAVEAEMAGVFAEMEGYRLANMRQAAAWIAARGPLRDDVERAAQTIWAIASPQLAGLMCDQLGWTQDQYAAWLEDVLARALLPGQHHHAAPVHPWQARRKA